MLKCFRDPKKLFPARNPIFDHFRLNGWPYCEKSKIHKITKKSILAKNSNVCRMADIGRSDDLWPEIRSGDFKKCFETKFQYVNQFISNFWKNEKNRFFRYFESGRGNILADFAFHRTNIGQMVFPAGLGT